MQTLDKDYKYLNTTLLISVVAALACSIVMFVNHKLYLLNGVSENLTFVLMIVTLLIISSLYFLRKIVFCTGNLDLKTKTGNKFELDNKSFAISLIKFIWKEVMFFTVFIAIGIFCALNFFVAHNILLGSLLLLVALSSIPLFISLFVKGESITYENPVARVFYIDRLEYYKYLDESLDECKSVITNRLENDTPQILPFEITSSNLYYCLYQAVISKHTTFDHISGLSSMIDNVTTDENNSASHLIGDQELTIIKKFHSVFKQINNSQDFKDLDNSRKKQALAIILNEIKNNSSSKVIETKPQENFPTTSTPSALIHKPHKSGQEDFARPVEAKAKHRVDKQQGIEMTNSKASR